MDRLTLPSVSLLPILRALNWEKCIFCQGAKGLVKGPLICPARNVIVTLKNKAYVTIALLEDLKTFTLFSLPLGHNVSALDNGWFTNSW